MSNPNYDELMQPVIAFLGCETPQAWLDEAVNNLELLMQDHANCEKKAAGTAMNLMFRYSFFYRLAGEAGSACTRRNVALRASA